MLVHLSGETCITDFSFFDYFFCSSEKQNGAVKCREMSDVFDKNQVWIQEIPHQTFLLTRPLQKDRDLVPTRPKSGGWTGPRCGKQSI